MALPTGLSPGATARALASIDGLEGIFPGGQPPILPEQPFVRGSLGYNVMDETARLAALASGRLSEYGDFDISPEVQSQSAQALIRSFAENPEVASLVSRKGDMRSAVDEALGTYLPSAMGVYDDPAQFQEPLTEARKGIMDLIDWGRVEEAGKAGEFSADFDYIPAQVSSGVGSDISVSALSSDRQDWSNKVNNKEDLSRADAQSHDTRQHLDAVYGLQGQETLRPYTGIGRTVSDYLTKISPEFIRDRVLRSSMGDSLGEIQNLVEDHTLGESFRTPSHLFPRIDFGGTSRGSPVSEEETVEAVQHALKDVVNNAIFTGARDAGISPEEVYRNDNVVFDEGVFGNTEYEDGSRRQIGLAQALVDEDVKASQLEAAVNLVRDAPEDKRVVESLTEKGLREIISQVDSFSEPTIEWTPPQKKTPKPTKTSKPKKAEVTPTVNIADLMREANRQRSAEMNKQLEAQRRKDLGFGWGDMWT
jgi:hypothetical protein